MEIQLLLVLLLLMPYGIIALLLGVLGRKTDLKKDYNYRPTLTVFLPTYNEEEFIEKKLTDLLGQTYPITEILVYDCSTDRTALIVEGYQKRFPFIKLFRQPARTGMARTVNQAFKEAKGEIFIKTDCDAIATSNDCIKELIANFADARVGGVSSIIVAEDGVEKYFRRFQIAIQRVETNIDSTVIAHSSLLAFRRSLVEPVDVNSNADDTQEFILIRRKGYRTIIDPDVVCREAVPSTFRMRRLQKDRRSKGVTDSLLQNISMLFNPKYGRYGSLVLPLELFILIVSPLLLITLGILFAFLLYAIHPLLLLALPVGLAISFTKRSSMISAIIDTELSALIGMTRALRKIDSSLWTKAR